MSVGRKFNVTIDNTTMNFKSVDIRETASSVDATSKLNRDATLNIGYSSTDGDIGTLFISIDELIEDAGVLSSIAFFEAGVVYADTTYSVAYDGVPLYSGTGFYVDEVSSSGNIPGEARVRFMIHSDGVYNKL